MKIGPYDLPSKYDLPVRAGVRFFICRYPRETENNKGLMGPFDVRCNEIPDYLNRRQGFDIKWHGGLNAGVQFYVQEDDKTAIAFMPDDVYYHNRIVLADHSWIYLEGLYALKTGMLSAAEAQMEIECLREVISCEYPIWKVVDRMGVEKDYRFNKEDAEEVLKTKKLVMVGKGQVVREVFPYKDCVLVPGKKLDKKPEIKELIKKYARAPYGWTSCDEFLQGFRLQIDQLIASRRRGAESKPTGQVDVAAHFKEWFQKLSPEQLQQMIASMGSSAGTGAPAVPQQPIVIPPVPQAPIIEQTASPIPEPATLVPAPEDDEIYTRSDLYIKRKDDLLTIAARYRLPLTLDNSKAEMTDAILTAQEQAATEVVR